MARITKIEWARNSDGSRGATFNPWVGCAKVGPGCEHCYAESWAKRSGENVWGPHAPRRRTTAAYWREAYKWDREAAAKGIRIRVFGGSLCDPFDNAAPESWREDYWSLIRATPNLDWIIVTKRIGNARKMLPDDWGDAGYPNVWLVATICTQAEADRDIRKLLAIPAAVHGLSMEPLLEDVDIRPWLIWTPERPGLGWVIVGGLSGSDESPMHPDRPRSLRDQCRAACVAFFFKQWGDWIPVDRPGTEVDLTRLLPNQCVAANPGTDTHTLYSRIGKKKAGRLFDGREWNEMPGERP